MTISALEGFRAEDWLERNLELYRDLSVALRERITLLMAGGGGDAEACKTTVEAVKAHQRALQTVLDVEASLVKRNRSWIDGGGRELDLDGARTEVVERLALWADGR
jgi:hypothetical protein